MSTITFNHVQNAPGCPGEIVNDADGRSILVTADWDYPSVARAFGWVTKSVQRCRRLGCGQVYHNVAAAEIPDNGVFICSECLRETDACEHDGTDGTVDCNVCGVAASEFVSSAGQFLTDNDGATAEDPGYFPE